MTQTPQTTSKPLKRLFAVSKRDEDDKRKADWIVVGAEWSTKTDGITRYSQNDAFVPLMATGKFDLVAKLVE